MNRRYSKSRELALLAALALTIFSPALLLAQAPSPAPAGFDGASMIAAIKSTPGSLGVETARTGSGKQVIFAWFEDKDAVLNWVNSEYHRGLVRGLASGASSGRAPLDGIADDAGPILAIASLTFAEGTQVPGVALPVSQIAIELYAPLPGGIAVGGRFAPAAVQVPGLLEAPVSAPTTR